LSAGDPLRTWFNQTPAVDAVEHPRPIERAAPGRALELRAQLEQMPPQPIDHVAITVTELNPHNAASDDGLLERFAGSLAYAICEVPDAPARGPG
jgi:hypothetical protein